MAGIGTQIGTYNNLGWIYRKDLSYLLTRSRHSSRKPDLCASKSTISIHKESQFKRALPKAYTKCQDLLKAYEDTYFGACWTDDTSLWVVYNFKKDEDRYALFEFFLTQDISAYDLNIRD